MKSSPVNMRTPWGSRLRTEISDSASNRLILTPATLSGFSSMMSSSTAEALCQSSAPKYPFSSGSKAVPSQCSTTGTVARDSTSR